MNPYKRILKYSCFDLDDNLLFMPTTLTIIKDNQRIICNSNDLAKIKKLIGIDYFFDEKSFDEYRDYGKRGENALIEDVEIAIKNKKLGPSWKYFIKNLIEGNIFAIITARGHNSSTMKRAIEWIINNYLTDKQRVKMLKNLEIWNQLFNIKIDNILDEYLNSCKYYCVTSEEFSKNFNFNPENYNVEDGKKIAIKDFTDKVHQHAKKINIQKIKLSFSDDDIKNIEIIKNYMNDELLLEYPMDMIIYDSSNNKLKKSVIKRM